MTLISAKSNMRYSFLFLAVLSFLSFTSPVHAQSQSLSVTPPLFQLSINPGDIWQSSVRVVNSNTFPLTVYAEVVNFSAEGEGGLGKFMPSLQSDDAKATMAEWIELGKGPYVILPGASQEVSFFIEIPTDAAPGGHFAAILISTEPPKAEGMPLALITSQTVASLFFVRVEGEIIEKADIRELSVLDRPLELPEAEFSLRFENKGNVHLQPKGDIVITNMWGKERGVIPVNHATHFGNVLPESIRDFRFSWKGERSLTDIGRYKAVATLAYGEDGIKSTSRIAYFWVIPVKGAFITVGTLLLFIYALTWMIRRYIRRMLILAGVDPDQQSDDERDAPASKRSIKLSSYKNVSAPLRIGAAELRSELDRGTEAFEIIKTILFFIVKQYRFFLALIVLIAGFIGLVVYIGEVGNTNTDYEVTIEEGGSERTLTNDEIESSSFTE